MPDLKRSTVAIATLLVVLAACGGGGGTSTTSPTSGATQATATDTPSNGSTEEPGATPAETVAGGGGGGGGAGDACELVTAEEAGAILGADGVTTELTAGEFSYCFYRDGAGDLFAASSYTARGGGAIFGTWAAGAGVQPVDGIGDDAVFDPSSATLFVSVGDAIYGITAGISSDAEAQRLDWAEEFGKIAAGRM